MSDPYSADQPSTPQQPGPDPYGSGQQPGPQPEQPGYGAPGAPAYGAPQQGYPPQGQPPAYPQAPYPPAYGYAPDPPGKTMGIVGFVLAFVIAPAGIVVSAMALSESKKVGYDNVLGKWGLWLSIIFTALWVLYVLFIVLAVFGGMFAAFTSYESSLSAGQLSV